MLAQLLVFAPFCNALTTERRNSPVENALHRGVVDKRARDQDSLCELTSQYGSAVWQQTLPSAQQSRLTKQHSFGASQHDSAFSQHIGQSLTLQQSAPVPQQASPSEQQSPE